MRLLNLFDLLPRLWTCLVLALYLDRRFTFLPGFVLNSKRHLRRLMQVARLCCHCQIKEFLLSGLSNVFLDQDLDRFAILRHQAVFWGVQPRQ